MRHGKVYVKLMNSKEWRELRNRVLREQPLCERCKQQGYYVAARCVHHIVPVETGKSEAECRQLAYTRSNLQALCLNCHSEIHRMERSHSKASHQQRSADRLQQWVDRHLPSPAKTPGA